ncbi:MAG: RagB/SusD family nutrient uptake outer membrane protein [Flavisolibacter sp.]|nr:RagB/SusD family nutrient uptake outer membrane protein [Flavisolibacter sp.]
MNNKLISLLVFIIILSASCKKYLDLKPDKTLAVPTTIADLQALLDNNEKMNTNRPSLGEVSADDYYLTNTNYAAVSLISRNAYIWDTAVNSTTIPNSWSYAFDPVYFSNVVLEKIDKISFSEQTKIAWNNVKGSALFFRARSFLAVAWIWAKAFDPPTANTDLGIPLRLTSDFNTPSKRSNLQQTYDQIIDDLKNAIGLLPVKPANAMRPSKPAAYALLARTYLSMRQYDKAGLYADSCLQLYNQLLDYNDLNASQFHPVARFNKEVIFHSTMEFVYYNLYYSYSSVDSNLYNSYDSNDLRRTIFLKANPDGSHYFAGSYDNSANLFNGIATDEIYLIRAECFARANNVQSALNDLNTLLEKRWRKGSFVPFSATTAPEALNLILLERRKELLFRDLRWSDVKRFNKEGANIILKRIVNSQSFTLQPNENRYALPLPPDVVNLSGMQQNRR